MEIEHVSNNRITPSYEMDEKITCYCTVSKDFFHQIDANLCVFSWTH